MTNWKNWAIMLLAMAVPISAYYIGRHHKDPTIKWYSDMTSQLQGHKIYLIDTPVVCPNRMVKTPQGGMQMVPGRELGKLQIDINLQTGETKVITNTVPAWFKCEQ